MSKKILKVTIKYRDEKTTESFRCVDFPNFQGPFLFLALEGFKNRYILTEMVMDIKTEFIT